MIEFKGDLTGACRRNALKDRRVRLVGAALCTSVVGADPCVVISNIVQEQSILLFLILPIFIILVALLLPNKEIQKTSIPFRICAYPEEKTITYEFKSNRGGISEESIVMIDDVPGIVDYGEWYSICLDVGLVETDIHCQKSLLTQGTLEEFEALFEGKIERKSLGKK